MDNAFTYEQAQEICDDFEDMEGTELIVHLTAPVNCDVEHVAIAPYHRADKDTFMQVYTETLDTQKALATYTGNEFDVLVIAHNATDKNDVVVQTIREYIKANGVRYNFPD